MKWGTNAGTCRKCDGVDGWVNTKASAGGSPEHLRNRRSRVRPGKVSRGSGERWGQKGLQRPAQDPERGSGWLSRGFVSIFTWRSTSQACASSASPSDKLHCHMANLASLFWGTYITSFSMYLEVDFSSSKLNFTIPTGFLFVLLLYHSPHHPRNTSVVTSELSLNLWLLRQQLSAQQLFWNVSWMIPPFHCWHPTTELITKIWIP